jgi:hypothetical protein
MVGIAVVCLVWAGMVVGISFLETPVKFKAPSVTLAVGLDVGRHVFRIFNRVEIAAAIACASLAALFRPGRAVWLLLAVPCAAVALQTFWLLPVLGRRTVSFLNGETPKPAPYHHVYVALDLAKLLCLLAAGVMCVTPPR